MNKIKNSSARKIWWRQFKTIVRELLRLIQNYSKSINERQSRINSTHQNISQKSRIFDYNDESDKNFDRLTEGLNNAVGVNHDYSALTGRKPKPKRRRKNENYQDPWVKDSNDEIDFVNDIFGFKKPEKKGKRRRTDDYGFNTENVFDL